MPPEITAAWLQREFRVIREALQEILLTQAKTEAMCPQRGAELGDHEGRIRDLEAGKHGLHGAWKLLMALVAVMSCLATGFGAWAALK